MPFTTPVGAVTVRTVPLNTKRQEKNIKQSSEIARSSFCSVVCLEYLIPGLIFRGIEPESTVLLTDAIHYTKNRGTFQIAIQNYTRLELQPGVPERRNGRRGAAFSVCTFNTVRAVITTNISL